MGKIYITKKRDAELHVALSIDDYLYEKHRRWEQEVMADLKRQYNNRRKIVSVVGVLDGIAYQLQIEDVQMTDQGSQVIVQLPKPTAPTEQKENEDNE